MDPIIDYRASSASVTISRFMSRVFGWMTFGLMITAVVAYVVGMNAELMHSILAGGGFIGIVVLQFALVLGLSFGLNRMSVGVATFCFLLYAFSIGITSSVLFAVYQLDGILQAFTTTAGMFACLSFYGYTTKKDMSGMGTFLMMALFGGILAIFVNFFFHSSLLALGINIAMIFVFAGLTVYDTQRIKKFAMMGDSESDVAHKYAIMGALALYLDFINMFYYLLNLMGGRRRN